MCEKVYVDDGGTVENRMVDFESFGSWGFVIFTKVSDNGIK